MTTKIMNEQIEDKKMKIYSVVNKNFSIEIERTGERGLIIFIKNIIGNSMRLSVDKEEFIEKFKELLK